MASESWDMGIAQKPQLATNEPVSTEDSDRSILNQVVHDVVGTVWHDEKSKVRCEFEEYATQFVAATPLFIGGTRGYVASAVLFGLNQAKVGDTTTHQLEDMGLGAAKGLLTKGTCEYFGGKKNWNFALKGVAMGVSSRALDMGLTRQTYDNQGKFDLAGGLGRTLMTTLHPVSLATDIAVFGVAHGAPKLLPQVCQKAIEASPFLTSTLTGTTFGFTSGALGEAQHQWNDPQHHFDLLTVLERGTASAVSTGLSAAAGYKLTTRHSFKPITFDPTEQSSSGERQPTTGFLSGDGVSTLLRNGIDLVNTNILKRGISIERHSTKYGATGQSQLFDFLAAEHPNARVQPFQARSSGAQAWVEHGRQLIHISDPKNFALLGHELYELSSAKPLKGSARSNQSTQRSQQSVRPAARLDQATESADPTSQPLDKATLPLDQAKQLFLSNQPDAAWNTYFEARISRELNARQTEAQIAKELGNQAKPPELDPKRIAQTVVHGDTTYEQQWRQDFQRVFIPSGGLQHADVDYSARKKFEFAPSIEDNLREHGFELDEAKRMSSLYPPRTNMTLAQAQEIETNRGNWTPENLREFFRKNRITQVGKWIGGKVYSDEAGQRVTQEYLDGLTQDFEYVRPVRSVLRSIPNEVRERYDLRAGRLIRDLGLDQTETPVSRRELAKFIKLWTQLAEPGRTFGSSYNPCDARTVFRIANSPLHALTIEQIKELVPIVARCQPNLPDRPGDIWRLGPALKAWKLEPTLPVKIAERVGEMPVWQRVAAKLAWQETSNLASLNASQDPDYTPKPFFGDRVAFTNRFWDSFAKRCKQGPMEVFIEAQDIPHAVAQLEPKLSANHAKLLRLLAENLSCTSDDQKNPVIILKGLNSQAFSDCFDYLYNRDFSTCKIGSLKNFDSLVRDDPEPKMALALALTFGDNWQDWLNVQKQLGRDRESSADWLPNTLSTENANGLSEWLFRFAGHDISDLSVVANSWDRLNQQQKDLPYDQLVDFAWRSSFYPGLKECPERIQREVEKMSRWKQLAARVAWQGVPVESAETMNSQFWEKFTELTNQGRMAILRQAYTIGGANLCLDVLYPNLSFDHGKILAGLLSDLASQKQLDVLTGVEPDKFEDALNRLEKDSASSWSREPASHPDRLNPQNYNAELRHYIQNTWEPQAALGLALAFGKGAKAIPGEPIYEERLCDGELKKVMVGRGPTVRQANWEYWLDTQRKLGRTEHDASYWLPIAGNANGLDSWLYRFADRDIAELSVVARRWEQLSAEQRKLPYKELVDLATAVKYVNQKDRGFAKESAKWAVPESGYAGREGRWLASLEVPCPFPLDKVWQLPGNELKARFIPRNDPRAVYLGMHTNCCQHPDGVGQSAAWYGQESPNSGFFVIEDDSGEVVAQSFAWISDDGGLCFDSVESKGLGERKGKVQELYQKVANDLSAQYHTITLGVGTDHLGISGWNPANEHLLPWPTSYSGYTADSKKQVLLAHNPALPKKPVNEFATWVRGAREEDMDAAKKIAQAVYPKDWDHIPEGDYGLVLQDAKQGPVGYAIFDIANRELNDVAIVPEFRPKSRLLLNKILDKMRQVGGVWKADARASTSYKLLQYAARQGLIQIQSSTKSESMNGEPMYKIEFTVPKEKNSDSL